MEADKAVLTTFEQPARIYCTSAGLDPDEQIPTKGAIAGVPKLVPQWHFAAMELHDLSLKINALRAGAQPPQVVN